MSFYNFTLINRYARKLPEDEFDEDDCDVVLYDRVTGKEVMRYDGADPANTDPRRGGMSSDEHMRRLGYDPNSEVDKHRCRTPVEEHELCSWRAGKAKQAIAAMSPSVRGVDLMNERFLPVKTSVNISRDLYDISYEEIEKRHIIPALEKMGYILIFFKTAEEDIDGPLVRTGIAKRAATGSRIYRFTYG